MDLLPLLIDWLDFFNQKEKKNNDENLSDISINYTIICLDCQWLPQNSHIQNVIYINMYWWSKRLSFMQIGFGEINKYKLCTRPSSKN